jgi:hypothetical protein
VEPLDDGKGVTQMENFASLFWPAFIQGIGIALKGFGDAFVANPWPFLAVGGFAIVGALMPRASRR